MGTHDASGLSMTQHPECIIVAHGASWVTMMHHESTEFWPPILPFLKTSEVLDSCAFPVWLFLVFFEIIPWDQCTRLGHTRVEPQTVPLRFEKSKTWKKYNYDQNVFGCRFFRRSETFGVSCYQNTIGTRMNTSWSRLASPNIRKCKFHDFKNF